MAKRLATESAYGFVVATVTEGVELRRAGIAQPILVSAGLVSAGLASAGVASVDPFRAAVEYGLTVTVWSRSSIEQLAAAAREIGIGPAPVHLKVDTGMSRLGVTPEHALEHLQAIVACTTNSSCSTSVEAARCWIWIWRRPARRRWTWATSWPI